jgi:farnesyl diphosphate synthase
VDLNRFSIEKHTVIVKYKTAFYSFYLPVAMAMLMAGVKEEAAYKHAQSILIEMGIFFQVQDDYLDCYGDPEVIGKIGTDIQDNKCGWLVVQALARATPEQRKVLEVGRGGAGGGVKEGKMFVLRRFWKEFAFSPLLGKLRQEGCRM